MHVDFTNIYDYIIPIKDFSLGWRFTDEKYNKLPDAHLNQLQPLNTEASEFLWKYISDSRLHDDTPFKRNYFKTIDKAKILIANDSEIKKWLYHRGLPFNKNVFLSWQPSEAMIVPWKIFIKYYDNFYYTDDLTIIDDSLTWALLFYHENEIYFGTNKDFIPDKAFDKIDFIW